MPLEALQVEALKCWMPEERSGSIGRRYGGDGDGYVLTGGSRLAADPSVTETQSRVECFNSAVVSPGAASIAKVVDDVTDPQVASVGPCGKRY